MKKSNDHLKLINEIVNKIQALTELCFSIGFHDQIKFNYSKSDSFSDINDLKKKVIIVRSALEQRSHIKNEIDELYKRLIFRSD
mgnify:CR=1 FL=1|jgi:hypothetical protein